MEPARVVSHATTASSSRETARCSSYDGGDVLSFPMREQSQDDLHLLRPHSAAEEDRWERMPRPGISLDLGLLSGRPTDFDVSSADGKDELADPEHVVTLLVQGPRIENRDGVELRLSSSCTLQAAREQLLPYLRPSSQGNAPNDQLHSDVSFWFKSTRLSFEEPLSTLLRPELNMQSKHVLHFGHSPTCRRGRSGSLSDVPSRFKTPCDRFRGLFQTNLVLDQTRIARGLDQAGELNCTDIRGKFIELLPSGVRPFVKVIVPSRSSAYFDVSWTIWDYCSSLKPSMLSVVQEPDELPLSQNTARVVVGNPFGVPDKRGVWDEQTTSAIGATIRREFDGECPLYSTFVVETPGSACRYLLYVCGFFGQFEAGNTLEDIGFYTVFRASFSATSRHNRQAAAGDRINALCLDLEKNLFPPSQTHFPLESVAHSLARQLFISLLTWFYPPKKAATAHFGVKLGALLTKRCSLTSVDYRQQFYRIHLPSGNVPERGVSLAQMSLLLDVLEVAYLAYLGALAKPKHKHRHKPRLNSSKRGWDRSSPEEAVSAALVDRGFATSDRTADRLFVRALTACVQLAWPIERAVGIRTAIRTRKLMPLLVAWVADGWNCAAPKTFILKPEVCAHTSALPSEIDELGPVARGATATVVRGTWCGQTVALKNFEVPIVAPSLDMRDSEEGYQLRAAWREIVVASMLRHPNLTPCLAAILPGDATGGTEGVFCTSMIMPLMDSDLRTVLDNTPESLSDEDRLSILLQVAGGIEYLHSCGVVHRDVKSLNVLLSPQQQPRDGTTQNQTQVGGRVAQLTDFGSCRPLWTHDQIPQEQQQMTAGIGTTAWMAPELFTGQPYGKEVDGEPQSTAPRSPAPLLTLRLLFALALISILNSVLAGCRHVGVSHFGIALCRKILLRDSRAGAKGRASGCAPRRPLQGNRLLRPSCRLLGREAEKTADNRSCNIKFVVLGRFTEVNARTRLTG
jgi:serine/threonine protein kinase